MSHSLGDQESDVSCIDVYPFFFVRKKSTAVVVYFEYKFEQMVSCAVCSMELLHVAISL